MFIIYLMRRVYTLFDLTSLLYKLWCQVWFTKTSADPHGAINNSIQKPKNSKFLFMHFRMHLFHSPQSAQPPTMQYSSLQPPALSEIKSGLQRSGKQESLNVNMIPAPSLEAVYAKLAAPSETWSNRLNVCPTISGLADGSGAHCNCFMSRMRACPCGSQPQGQAPANSDKHTSVDVIWWYLTW